ncbi:sugar phosphate nucleotidyltransferase [Nocardia anaemiae]|uniref:sugar phosphate nucleotidyltransferase n=1 Tax=Nocardia anaemiae TaxID=263910 RepID=UPI000A044AE4|nr:sugar phosphate nucleotidyltransferase [Nocardia anaemiae]
MSDHRSVHGILLLGGRGTRLRPAYTGNKHLITVGGRAMADYGLELLTRCGIDSLTAVVGPDDVDAFERLFARTAPDYDITFIVQPHPLGTADALQRCAATVDEPYVATLWGDNLFEVIPEPTVHRFLADPAPCMITIAHSPNPQHFSTATLTGGRVTAIVDKPAEPTTNLVCAGLMLFESTALFESVGRVRQNRRGEREAMDAVRAFLRAGELRFDRITGQWFDAAFSPESLTEAEQFALHRGFNHPSNSRQETLAWT